MQQTVQTRSISGQPIFDLEPHPWDLGINNISGFEEQKAMPKRLIGSRQGIWLGPISRLGPVTVVVKMLAMFALRSISSVLQIILREERREEIQCSGTAVRGSLQC